MQRKFAHLIQRYNSSSTWANDNPILLCGEIGIESDTNKVKLGDGITNWNSLGYIVSMSSMPIYSAGSGAVLYGNILSAEIQYDILEVI